MTTERNSMSTIPTTMAERYLAQRTDALVRANYIRSRRVQLKADMKRGDDDAQRIITNPPDWAVSMKVWTLLVAIPEVRDTKATRIMRRCDVSPPKTLGALSQRQRMALVRALDAQDWNSAPLLQDAA